MNFDNIDLLSEDELIELEELLLAESQDLNNNHYKSYFPANGPLSRDKYPKHMQFFEAGAEYKLRLIMAANRVGKTVCAVYEVALHLHGHYPDWWKGKRYNHQTNWWVCGEDSKSILQLLQPTFLGSVGDFGSGMIPHEYLDHETLKDAKRADTPITAFRVKHKSGGMSSVSFKSYESGREAFQSWKGSVYLDEEPPLAIFSECLMRTMNDENMLIMTFTPLKGPTDTILNFIGDKPYADGPVGVGKHVTMASWDDVPHISEKDKDILLNSIPPWQRDSRTKGIPQMGSGVIYQVSWDNISVPRFEIPKHWKRYAGMDVGNKTAAIWFAISPDNGVHYAYHEYYREGALPSTHAESIVPLGSYIPIAIDHAAHGRSQIDGNNLFDMYKELGLNLHNADKSVEAGLYTCWELLTSGRLKIFSDLSRFAKEYQTYRKDEKGQIVKKDDHVLDAFRYGIMTGRDLAINEMDSKPRQHISSGVSAQYRPRSVIGRSAW